MALCHSCSRQPLCESGTDAASAPTCIRNKHNATKQPELNMKQLILVVLIAAAFGLAPGAHGQTTAFTYQGRLNQGTNGARGTFDMQFSLFNVASGGAALTGPISATLAVTNGLFNVPLDFG